MQGVSCLGQYNHPIESLLFVTWYHDSRFVIQLPHHQSALCSLFGGFNCCWAVGLIDLDPQRWLHLGQMPRSPAVTFFFLVVGPSWPNYHTCSSWDSATVWTSPYRLSWHCSLHVPLRILYCGPLIPIAHGDCAAPSLTGHGLLLFMCSLSSSLSMVCSWFVMIPIRDPTVVDPLGCLWKDLPSWVSFVYVRQLRTQHCYSAAHPT